MVMPNYKIVVDDKDLSSTIKKFDSRISVIEQAGDSSNYITIAIADPHNKIALPSDKAQIDLSLGYDSKLHQMGRYIVDEIRLSGAPDLIEITARATPFCNSKEYNALQSQKSRHFDNINLSELAEKIAKENGLKSSIAERAKKTVKSYVCQDKESDMNLLSRLCQNNNFIFNISHGMIILIDPLSKKSNTGLELPTFTLNRDDVSSYDFLTQGRLNFKSVVAYFREFQSGVIKIG